MTQDPIERMEAWHAHECLGMLDTLMRDIPSEGGNVSREVMEQLLATAFLTGAICQQDRPLLAELQSCPEPAAPALTVDALRAKLTQLPRFPGGCSFLLLNGPEEECSLVTPATCRSNHEPQEYLFETSEQFVDLIDRILAHPHTGTCRVCGCTDSDCSGCINRTGQPCHWKSPNLCSACAPSFGPFTLAPKP